MKKKTMQRTQFIFLACCLLLDSLSAPSLAADVDLFHAIQSGDLARVEALIAAGADVNARSKNDGTPLMLASIMNYPEVVRALIAAGADVNAKQSSEFEEINGYTALMMASQNCHLDAVQILIAAGSRFD